MNAKWSGESLLERLRNGDAAVLGRVEAGVDGTKAAAEWEREGVAFVSSSPRFEEVYRTALSKLLVCIRPLAGGPPALLEGGAYWGAWLESTGTISAEVLSRFVPGVAEETFRLFARHQKEDGQLPYKVTDQGPAYRQIQTVTPLARSVWNHWRLSGAAGQDRETSGYNEEGFNEESHKESHKEGDSFLAEMYRAMARNDKWLAANRDTRGTGCTEAFCTFDTGHDLSPRFWHVPDTCYGDDARHYDPDSPVLPFLAPDLTANVYCQRIYLAEIVLALGGTGGGSAAGAVPGSAVQEAATWREQAQRSLESLFRHCYDPADDFFYDVNRSGDFVKVQSDVLLRVLACEAGDGELFDRALRRYLLHTGKFFAKYPLTSLAMDDPRFDPSSTYNSWGGPTNFLTLIRTPHAFEHHGKYVELTWIMQPILSAMARMTRFSQTLSPWTGEEGYTDTYSPAVLCLLDFVERMCGILPRPDGEVWFTALVPSPLDHGEEVSDGTGYARSIDGTAYELVNTRQGGTVYRNEEAYMQLPYGLRATTDRNGQLLKLTGMSVRTVEGSVVIGHTAYPVTAKGNEQLRFTGSGFETVKDPGMAMPSY